MMFGQAGNTSRVTTVPSPTGGLNAYSSLASMPATDAIRLENLVPQPYGCTVRRGYMEWATGLGAAVESLSMWTTVSGVNPTKMFAFAGGNMWDVTSQGAVIPADKLLTSLTSNVWQSVFMSNAAGPHTLIFNGSDNPIWYSNAGLQRLTAGNGTDNGTWKNIDPAKLIQGTIHQRRVWAVEKNSTCGWFLPADSVYGVAEYFDFGALFKHGGYLAMLGTWTIDLGEGSNDHLVAVSSRGDAVVFQGTDVTNAATWNLVGVYFIGPPVSGRRFMANRGGDLMILTAVGLVSLATLVTSTKLNVSADSVYSQKVAFLISELVSELQPLPGWSTHFFPGINLLYINVPSVVSGGSGQLVCNDIITAWCTFSGMNALCWMWFNDAPFFGHSDGTVYKSWFGHMDKVKLDGTDGVNILSAAQQAYTFFDNPAAQKQVGLYRPTFLGSRIVGYASTIRYDYEEQETPLPTSATGTSSFPFWGHAQWGIDHWSGGMITQRDWSSGTGLGTAVSIALNLSTTSESTWVSTDYTVKTGGPL